MSDEAFFELIQKTFRLSMSLRGTRPGWFGYVEIREQVERLEREINAEIAERLKPLAGSCRTCGRVIEQGVGCPLCLNGEEWG